MSAQTIGEGDREAGAEAPEPVNEVRLAGRISAGPEERVLPSGDVLWTFRIVVPRPPAGRAGVRAGVDALECAVWGGRVRRSVAGWGEGDLVEVTGAHSAPVLQDRRWSGVEGRGRGRLGSTHSSRSDRMSTPRLGLGWNDVAFSGNNRSSPAMRSTRSTSGAGSSTAAPTSGLHLGQGVLDGMVVPDP